MFERYSRQMLFAPIGSTGQEKLKKSKVLIVGMGALGTAAANHLVRSGVGFLRFVDRDYVELSNLQRQMLFDEDDVRESLPKAVAAERKLRKINSSISIEGIVADVTAANIEEFLVGIDLIVDGTDNFSTRFLLNDAAFKNNIPYVYGGVVSSRGMSALFIPEKTPCLRCFITEGDGSGETCDTVGVISPIVDIVSSYEVTEALKYLAEDHHKLRNGLISIDVWQNRTHVIPFGEAKQNCPTCQRKEYPALKIDHEEIATSLCGRETVQIKAKQSFLLNEWSNRLKPIADVKETPFLLRVQLKEGERLVLFPDGRVLVQGTEDIVRAKTLYARYIGL
ncbi:thiamine biosynthesis protein ThiF [Pueribacillus theae]|uniref:Thiamine biosynthesis protein ThiF n=1 Tax=Pueribacillus theae TaxID=2171751 RepID=A0A2U1K899_9BACI|nr:ThiF family adenylyltransferase [Pueribacillus theae]PWA13574.1 thiamine biosynthesis protein ThiF [Pueribacillus theae]